MSQIFTLYDFRYNAMFRFLLYVKRVQLELQQCWATQMHRCHLGAKVTNSSHWWLRNHMAFLVDNLQYYLQVCINPHDRLRCMFYLFSHEKLAKEIQEIDSLKFLL